MTLSPDGKYVAYTRLRPRTGRRRRGDRPPRPERQGTQVRPRRPAAARDARRAGSQPPGRGSARFGRDCVAGRRPRHADEGRGCDKAKADKVKPDGRCRSRCSRSSTCRRRDRVAGSRIERAFTVGGDGAGFLVYRKPAQPNRRRDAPARRPNRTPEPRTRAAFGKGGKAAAVAHAGPHRPAARPARYGTDLLIRDLATGTERTLRGRARVLADQGRQAARLHRGLARRRRRTACTRSTRARATPAAIKAGPGRYSRLTWDEKQTKLAFFHDSAEASTRPEGGPAAAAGRARRSAPPPPLPRRRSGTPSSGTPRTRGAGRCASAGSPPARRSTDGRPAGRSPRPDTARPADRLDAHRRHARLLADGTKLYVTTAPKREPTPATPRPAPPPRTANRVELDIWHWKDDYIQPMQKVRGDVGPQPHLLRPSYSSTRSSSASSSDETLAGRPARRRRLGASAPTTRSTAPDRLRPRACATTPLVNVRTGETEAAPDRAQRVRAAGRRTASTCSPSTARTGHQSRSPDGKKTNLTAKLKVKFFNEDDDTPSDAAALRAGRRGPPDEQVRARLRPLRRLEGRRRRQRRPRT